MLGSKSWATCRRYLGRVRCRKGSPIMDDINGRQMSRTDPASCISLFRHALQPAVRAYISRCLTRKATGPYSFFYFFYFLLEECRSRPGQVYFVFLKFLIRTIRVMWCDEVLEIAAVHSLSYRVEMVTRWQMQGSSHLQIRVKVLVFVAW